MCRVRRGDFAFARYDTDGSLDVTFDGDGLVTTALTAEGDSANAVVIEADGKIVAAGYAGDGTFAVARYNTDGSLDVTFDGDGMVTTDLIAGFDTAGAVAIQTDGKILAAGEAGFLGEWTGSFGLVRYDTDGSLDTTFGADGKVITGFTSDDDSAKDVAIQGDGNIVAAGSAGFNGATAKFALARYLPDGTLDPSFSDNGRVVTKFSLGFDFAAGVAIQSDGQIVAAGSTYPDIDGLDAMFALARYEG